MVTKLRVTDDTGTTPPTDLIRLTGVAGIKDGDRPLGTTSSGGFGSPAPRSAPARTSLCDETMDPVLTPDAAEDVVYV